MLAYIPVIMKELRSACIQRQQASLQEAQTICIFVISRFLGSKEILAVYNADNPGISIPPTHNYAIVCHDPSIKLGKTSIGDATENCYEFY